jgi:hypothetical protein
MLTLAAPVPRHAPFRRAPSGASNRAAVPRGKQPGDAACGRYAEQLTVVAAELRGAFVSHL